MKPAFMLFFEDYETIKKLNESEKSEFLTACFEYNITGKTQNLSPRVDLIFDFFKSKFDFQTKKYHAICDRNALNGKKGGRPKDKKKPKITQDNPVGFDHNPKEPKEANSNSNSNSKENINNAVAKATTPQADFVNQFSKIYNAKTGQMFKAGKEDYILIANMLKQFGLEVVASKLRTLSELCENQSVWFTKDGFSSFTIKKLSQFWNEIIPKESEAEKSDRIVREMVAERMRERNERA